MTEKWENSPPHTDTHKPMENTTDTRIEASPTRHPLGPLVTVKPLCHPVTSRLYAAGLALAAGILLYTAAGLVPSKNHIGTHQQLKLPPCGFVIMTGFPCPTCGMTTAYAYTVRGRFIQAIRSQIAGFLMALGTAALGIVSVVSAVAGRRPSINWYRINPTNMVWWLAALLILAWAVKITLGLTDGTLPAG
ncbi:MAG: DUF2752 domain-containing protein [Planctomycetota bacterium]|jgi:hypothetical protein